MEVAPRVQHVPTASSNELLRKFAELDSDAGDNASERKELRLALKRRQRSQTASMVSGKAMMASDFKSTRLVERRSLLPHPNPRLRPLGIGKLQPRDRDLKNRSILGTIEKTWRKTVEGASKVFAERHFNRHKRLVNDAV